MTSVTSILRKISYPGQLSSVVSLLQEKVSIPKLNTELLSLLKNVLRINNEDTQQYYGLIITHKVIHDSLKNDYSAADWNKITEDFSDVIISIFESVLNYQKSNAIKEKTFSDIVQHAANLLFPVVDKVDSLRSSVTKNGYLVILSVVCLDSLDFRSRKKVFILFIQILVKADLLIRKTILKNSDLLFSKLAELTLICGDFDTQERIIEILMRFSIICKQKLKKIRFWFQRHPQVLPFIDVLDYNNFDISCREFLNALNEKIEYEVKVITLPCLEAYANEIQLKKPNAEKYEQFWVDFSMSTGVIHIVCDSGDNAWLKIYVEQFNVRNMYCSIRKLNDKPNTKEILIELVAPLKVRLYSSEKYIVSVTLIFLEGPKFCALEDCFFQKCYAQVYKVEKQTAKDFSDKKIPRVLDRSYEPLHNPQCFCDGASSVSSIRTSSTSCTKKCHMPVQKSVMRNSFSAQRYLCTSTPKPTDSHRISSCSDKNKEVLEEENGKSKPSCDFSGKKDELSCDKVYQEPFSQGKTSIIRYARNPGAINDRSFKEMCEKKLSEIRSQSQSQYNCQNDLIQTKESSAKAQESNENVTMEHFSEDSPLYLTSRGPSVSFKKPLNNDSRQSSGYDKESKQLSLKDNKCKNINPEKNSSGESNLQKLKNLLLSGECNEYMRLGLVDSEKSALLPGSSVLAKRKDQEYPRVDPILPTEMSKKNNLSEPAKAEDDSNKQLNSSGLEPVTFGKNILTSNFISIRQSNTSNNSFDAKKSISPNNITSFNTLNYQTKKNDTTCESKTKKSKLLWSPKLLRKKEDQDIMNKSTEQIVRKSDVIYDENDSLKLSSKTSDNVTSRNRVEGIKGLYEMHKTPFQPESKLSCISTGRKESTTTPSPLSSNPSLMARNSSMNMTPKETLDMPRKLSNFDESQEIPMSTMKPSNSVKRELDDNLRDTDSSDNLVFKKPECQKTKKKVTRNYLRKPIADKKVRRGLKSLPSPNSSFHCRIPSKTYSTRNIKKDLTPDKIFENLKHLNSKRNLAIDDEGKQFKRKRKLFNPNDLLVSDNTPSDKELKKTVEVPNSSSASNSPPAKNNKLLLDKNLNNERKELKKNEEDNIYQTMSFKDVYDFDSGDSSSKPQKMSNKVRRSFRTLHQVNYIEISSDDSFTFVNDDSVKPNNDTKIQASKKQSVQAKDQDIFKEQGEVKQSDKPPKLDKFAKNEQSKIGTKENQEFINYSQLNKIAEYNKNNRPASLEKHLLKSKTESKSFLVKTSNETYRKGTDLPSVSAKPNAVSNEEIEHTSAQKKTRFNNSNIDGASEYLDQNELENTSSIFPTKNVSNVCPINGLTKTFLNKSPHFPSENMYPKDSEKDSAIISLVGKAPVRDILRDESESEMRLEGVPVEERKSDASSLELLEPPFRFSTESNNNAPPESAERINNSSKLNSTGIQGDTLNELNFLESIITNLENISLSGNRKKIIKVVGSLESSLKKLEMFTNSRSKELNTKCIEVKSNIEVMKSNLENMLISCDEFLQSFQTKMTDIKSIMTRLSKDVDADQETKIKIMQEIEKLCRDRKSNIRTDVFF